MSFEKSNIIEIIIPKNVPPKVKKLGNQKYLKSNAKRLDQNKS